MTNHLHVPGASLMVELSGLQVLVQTVLFLPLGVFVCSGRCHPSAIIIIIISWSRWNVSNQAPPPPQYNQTSFTSQCWIVTFWVHLLRSSWFLRWSVHILSHLSATWNLSPVPFHLWRLSIPTYRCSPLFQNPGSKSKSQHATSKSSPSVLLGEPVIHSYS